MKSLLYQLPLRWTLPGLIILGAIFLSLMNVMIQLPQEDRKVEAAVLERYRTLLNLMQISIEPMVTSGKWDEISAEITALGADEGIRLAAFVDDNNEILSATRFEWITQRMPEVWSDFSMSSAVKARRSVRGIFIWSDDKNELHAYYPVRVGGRDRELRSRKIGLIVIAIDLRQEKAEGRERLENSIITSTLTIFVMACLAWLFLHMVITRRMARMQKKVIQYAEGDYAVRMDMPGYDEVAQFGYAFDVVAALIQQDHLQLQENEQRYRSLVETIPYGIQQSDREGKITYTNYAYEAMFGYSPGGAIGTDIWDKQPTQQARDELRDYHRFLVEKMPDPQLYKTKNLTQDGRLIDIEVAWTYRLDARGEVIGFISVITDTTERIKLEKERQLAATVFENSLQGVMVTDADATILSVNPAFTEITGYDPEEAIGKTPRLMRSEQHDETFYDTLWDSINMTDSWQGEIWNRHKSGKVFPIWQSIRAVRDNEGKLQRYIAIFSDISEQKASQERINHLAHFDVLTDLPNRLLFNERLTHAIERARRVDGKLAVLFIDLDNFKTVNDTMGHPMGDQLLRTVAERLRQTLREGDTVARLGGDEFTVLLEDIISERDAEAVARKCLKVFATPVILANHEVYVTASLGIALYPQDGDDLHTVVRNADTAMYRAKERGKNAYQFYTTDMSAAAADRLVLESALRQAVSNEEFILYYQPKVDLRSGRITAVEALIRWQHPELGMVAPDRFIGLAEETGMIAGIGQWVMKTACGQMKQWLDAGLGLHQMAVNLSGYQVVHEDIVDTVHGVLSRSGLDATHLELEITESFVMSHLDEALQTLFKLKDLGVSLAIDDFGTGYSSLAYLKRLPVHRLKIDRSFVKDIPEDRDDEAISAAIIALARSLGLQVTAEGVEIQEQMDFLGTHGCDEVQGYFIAKPMPADELESFLKSA